MTNSAELGLLDGFERALINHRLNMVYQPKVSLVEALVRWNDPKHGPVAPSRFVPLAERYGLIDQLTQWGLRTTLRQWRSWAAEGLDTNIAFNISALSLEHLDFPDLVERMCRGLEVPTDRLTLELTEGATQPLIKLMDTLTRFRIKGIGLAIDDFGTGYSSLMQLRQLPFTELKIDRMFITDLPVATDLQIIVKSVIDLAHALGLTATAEGVETVEQLNMLRDLGCDVAQGYLFAAPLEPDELIAWSKRHARRWKMLVSPPADPALRRRVEARRA